MSSHVATKDPAIPSPRPITVAQTISASQRGIGREVRSPLGLDTVSVCIPSRSCFGLGLDAETGAAIAKTGGTGLFKIKHNWTRQNKKKDGQVPVLTVKP